MAIILEGKPVVKEVTESLKRRIEQLQKRAITPTLQIIRVGKRADDIAYERSLLKRCRNLTIACEVLELDQNVTQLQLEKAIEEANVNPSIHGILLFRPLPEHLDIERIKKLINPLKDVDCMSPTNIGNLLSDSAAMMVPCTSQAVVTLLDYYQIPLKGADIVVVGASFVVGRPLTMLLVDRFATVTVCNVHTKNVAEYTRKADIVVSACGVPKLLKEDYFHEQSVVVDVGINLDEDGAICGDVDFEQVVNHVQAITPSVGGVGVITTIVLLSHVVAACETAQV